MSVRMIRTLEEFDRLRPQLDALYAADPQADLFCAPWWMRSWFEITPYDWTVLVAGDEADQVQAYVPCGLRSHRLGSHALRRDLVLGTKPYGTLVTFACQAGREDLLTTIGRALVDVGSWDVLRCDEVHDPRLPELLGGLPGGLQEHADEPLMCPILPLEDEWDEHMKVRISNSKSRYNMRRRIRQTHALPGFDFSRVSEASFEADFADLLTLWAHRWGAMPDEEVAFSRHMYLSAIRHDAMWLRVVRSEGKPVAALGAFIDRVRGRYLYYTSGFAPEYSQISPGTVIVALAIQDAIAEGCTSFDFLAGGHTYKLQTFAAEERYAVRARYERRSLRGSLGTVMLRARDLIRGNRGAS